MRGGMGRRRSEGRDGEEEEKGREVRKIEEKHTPYIKGD